MKANSGNSLEGLDRLNPQDSLLRFSSYKTYDPVEDLYYGDLHPCDRPALEDEVRFVLPGYLSGSDYSGGSVEVSNHRLFVEEFGELDGVHNVYGGYGSYGVAIRLDIWRAGADRTGCTWFGADEAAATCDEDGACVHQMRAWLDELENYPVADEDDLCQVEFEAQDEAWDSWAESDFARAIKAAFPDDIEDVDVTDSGRFRAWFEGLREAANVYWENETGNSAHVDLERVADKLEDVGQVIEAAEQVEDGAPTHGFKLDLIRRVSYLPYCQTCGLLVSDEDAKTRDEALSREGTGPSHLTHQRIALERVVYTDPEVHP
jgi:hypothetical protein